MIFPCCCFRLFRAIQINMRFLKLNVEEVILKINLFIFKYLTFWQVRIIKGTLA